MSEFDGKLNQINGALNRVKAFERLLFLLVGIGGIVLAAAGLDVWLRPQTWGRWILALLPYAAVVSSLVILFKTLSQKRTAPAIAAKLESVYPQLDNRLINCVLFAREREKTSWLKLYLKGGVPGFNALDLGELKNRPLRKRGALALLGVVLLLALPALLLANGAWPTALTRVLLPFAPIRPPMFAQVLAVEPGDKTVVQGEAVELSVRATGRAGQSVDVEVNPSDDERSVMRIGTFAETDQEATFSYRVAKVSGTVEYRFLVGDAYPTEAHIITAVAPLAPETATIEVVPPAYTARESFKANALADTPAVPVGSELVLSLRCNRALAAATLRTDTAATPLKIGSDPLTLSARVTVTNGNAVTLEATDTLGLKLSLPVRYTLVEDKPPEIRLISPAGEKPALVPGAAPTLEFEASDEYGLGEIRVERTPRGAKADAAAEVLATWNAQGKPHFEIQWKGVPEDVSEDVSLRIAAFDGAPTPHRTVTRPISFAATNFNSAVAAYSSAALAARKTLGALLAGQKRNRAATQKLREALPAFDESPWDAARAAQEKLAGDAKELLKDPGLGTARVALGKVVSGPMAEAVSHLRRAVSGEADAREGHAARALVAMREVITLLGVADRNMARGEISQSESGLLALIDGILRGQTGNLDATRRAAEAKAEELAAGIVDAQDNLAQDMDAMTSYCDTQVKGDLGDPELTRMLKDAAAKAREWKLQATMVDIAEKMESPAYAGTIPTQISVTNRLVELRAMLKDMREARLNMEEKDAEATVTDLKARVEKLAEVQKKLTESLRANGSQGDKSEKLDEDELEEIAELREQMAQAVLKVATDLQSLPELDACNDLVTDVYRTFEEMEGNEKNDDPALKSIETGLQKEDWVLDQLKTAGEKIDEMEEWLVSERDRKKRDTENFDQEEFEGNSIKEVCMPEELQDIIGDLLDEEENEEDRKADDSLTNQGASNIEMGWGIEEGEYADYNASGKSGNQRPDHKDQDGRSQTGRQGMSDGEFMGATAAIGEGDKDIEKRRTKDSSQSGNVEEEGHTDAVATGGGKNSGYSQDKGMTGDQNTKRQDSKSEAGEDSVRPSQLTRDYDAVYAQAQKNGLPTFGLGKVANMSHLRDLLKKQNASPRQIAELSKKIRRELRATYTSLESGIASGDMGATASEAEADETLSSSPDEAPAEYREMVSDYFKAIDAL